LIVNLYYGGDLWRGSRRARARPAPRGWPSPRGTIRRKVSTVEGVAMAGKSPRKSNAKKQGKTLKEKQAAKKLEKAKRREASHIPPTGH
jgi:hypothetical protein